VNQTTVNSTDNQQSTVNQSGQYGVVTVNQNGPADISNVTQTGYYSNPWNAGSQYTAAAGWVAGGVTVNQGGSSANTSTVNQYSDFSGAGVTQTGAAGGSNTSTVNQNSGSENWAGVSQTAGAGVTNNSTVNQNGGMNVASVKQH
jgi:hypothetical protein